MELSLIVLILIILGCLIYFMSRIDKALTLWAASLVGSKNRYVGAAIVWAVIIVVGLFILGV